MIMDDSNKLWSSVGSAGTVDTADLAKVVFHNSVAQLGPGVPTVVEPHPSQPAAAAPAVLVTTRAVIRYGVAPLDGLSNPYRLAYGLRLFYRDGPGQVLARFIGVDIQTGTETNPPLVSFNSEVDAGVNRRHDNSFQVQQNLGTTQELDFVNNAYYVEVTLTASHNPNRPIANPPALSVIQLMLAVG
jgi:hypothetical protein